MNTENQTQNYEVIYAYVSDLSNRVFKPKANDTASCTTVQCSNKDNCGLFKRGECAMVGIFSKKCPYGRRRREDGYTRRANKFNEWVKERKERYRDVNFGIDSPKDIMSKVGDYVFLPYAHINMNKDINFESHGHVFSSGSYFLPFIDFTLETIIKIIQFTPQAMMGGEISSYQKEVVPKFLQHLKEQFPELLESVIEKVPAIASRFTTITNIGRKAILSTLTPNVGTYKDIHGGVWIWDGETLTSENSKASFILCAKIKKMVITPLGNVEVKITDENQVNENTQFLS